MHSKGALGCTDHKSANRLAASPLKPTELKKSSRKTLGTDHPISCTKMGTLNPASLR